MPGRMLRDTGAGAARARVALGDSLGIRRGVGPGGTSTVRRVFFGLFSRRMRGLPGSLLARPAIVPARHRIATRSVHPNSVRMVRFPGPADSYTDRRDFRIPDVVAPPHNLFYIPPKLELCSGAAIFNNKRELSVIVRPARNTFVIASLLLVSACSTTGHFVVPPGSKLYLGGRPEPVKVRDDGTVSVYAFGWDSMGVPPAKGIPYRLEQDGKPAQEGRLRTQLRVPALFLPPIVGILTVPTGLNPNITYNLVTGKQE